MVLNRLTIKRAQEIETEKDHVERDIYAFIHEQPFAFPRETRLWCCFSNVCINEWRLDLATDLEKYSKSGTIRRIYDGNPTAVCDRVV
jgi:hypothetical protein